MITIEFNEKYYKMPSEVWFKKTVILAAFTVKREDINKEFETYDTEYKGGKYLLPSDTLIIVLLLTGKTDLWTTIRKYNHENVKKYYNNVGNEVEIKRV